MLSRTAILSMLFILIAARYAPAQEVLMDGGVLLDSSAVRTPSPPSRTILSVDAVQLITFYNLTLHQVVGDRVALGIGLRIPRIASLSGRGFVFEARVHPAPPAFKGFYIAPSIAIGTYEATRENGETYSLRPFSIEAIAGWQFVLFDHLSLDGGIGFGVMMFLGGEAGIRVEEIPELPMGLRLGVGYAF